MSLNELMGLQGSALQTRGKRRTLPGAAGFAAASRSRIRPGTGQLALSQCHSTQQPSVSTGERNNKQMPSKWKEDDQQYYGRIVSQTGHLHDDRYVSGEDSHEIWPMKCLYVAKTYRIGKLLRSIPTSTRREMRSRSSLTS